MILEQPALADASVVAGLANNFQMTLTGIKKHIGVLERAERITTQKVGRVRTCRLGRRRLDEEAVEDLKQQETANGRQERTRARRSQV